MGKISQEISHKLSLSSPGEYILPAELWDIIATELFKYNVKNLIRSTLFSKFFKEIVLNNKSLNSKSEFISRCRRSDKSPLKKLKEAFFNGEGLECIEWIMREYEMTIDMSKLIYADITTYAFAIGESRFIKWIIEKTRLPYKDISESFLPEAAKYGNLEIIQFLIDRANITYENSEGTINKALLGSCEHGHLEVASWLVKRFNLATRNIKNIEDIIVMTCILGGLDILEWLITTFKLPFSTIKEFLSKNYIFKEACICSGPEMAEWMLKIFNLTITREDIISILKKIHRKDRLEIIEWLAETFNLTINDIKSSDIFQTACNNGHLKTVKCMIKVLNLNSEDVVNLCDYNIPLSNACRNGNLEFIEWVVETFNLTANDIKSTNAFQKACNVNRLDIIRFLEKTFNLNSEDIVNLCDYNVPLFYACNNGNLEFIEWVVETFKLTNKDIMEDGHNPKLEYCGWMNDTFNYENRYNKNRNIFFWAACENGHLEIVKYLSNTFNLYISTIPDWNSEAKKRIVKHEDILEFIEKKHGVDIKYEFRNAKKAFKKEVKKWKFDGRRRYSYR